MDARCRLCAEVYDELIEILKEADLSAKIYKLFQVDIASSDRLPQTICQKCYETIHATWNFNEQVQNAQLLLAQEYIMKPPLIHSPIPNENNIVKSETVFLLSDYDEEERCVKNENPTIESESEELMSTKRCDEYVYIKSEVQSTSANEFQNDSNHTERTGVKTTERIQGGRKKSEIETATTTVGNVLPQKSKEVYEHYYRQFMDWKTTKCENSFSENVVATYFSELSKKMKPSTLWKLYSILRATIKIKHNIDLANYTKLRVFLKGNSNGFQVKKSKTLTEEEIRRFIDEAPDELYLATKVALIVGVIGACRKHELWQVKNNHIQDLGEAILIRVPDTKSKYERQFTIIGQFCTIFKKYWALRPANCESQNFFLNYQKGRCTKQVIGLNKFGNMPKQIATFLKLSDPEQYTGHCFRRSSAILDFIQ